MYGHRFQVLLDDERYQRVAAAARERGVSAASVIREAIDRGLPSRTEQRRASLRTILAAEPMDVPDDPADLAAEIDEARTAGL
jgi:hypothetical protein